jgi:hypothetical protein
VLFSSEYCSAVDTSLYAYLKLSLSWLLYLKIPAFPAVTNFKIQPIIMNLAASFLCCVIRQPLSNTLNFHFPKPHHQSDLTRRTRERALPGKLQSNNTSCSAIHLFSGCILFVLFLSSFVLY